MKQKYNVDMHIVENTLIGEARNKLLEDAVNGYLNTGRYDYVLWCDSDHIFDIKLFETLKFDMENANIDMVSALYFSRRSDDIKPIVLFEDKEIKNQYHHLAEVPENMLIEVDGCGFGFFLMKPKILKQVYNKYPKVFTVDNEHSLGEDILFLNKAKEFGYRPYVDTSCVIRHYGGSVGIEEYQLQKKVKNQ